MMALLMLYCGIDRYVDRKRNNENCKVRLHRVSSFPYCQYLSEV